MQLSCRMEKMLLHLRDFLLNLTVSSIRDHYTDSDFQLEPSSKLSYTPCYNGNYCSRLVVPLNWNISDQNAQAILAIIRRPAQVDVTHPDYGGAILFNFGGPGGSGVELIALYGPSLDVILNSKGTKYYDLIGWDPRGVGHSTPILDGFPNPISRHDYIGKLADTSETISESSTSFNKFYDMKGLYGKLLASSIESSNISTQEHPARFMGTTSVARDMIEIIERHGEWREEIAEMTLKARSDISSKQIQSIRARTIYTKNAEQLQYWGFSYGTVLGYTFASLYPDRVQRMIFDGIANFSDYRAGNWQSMLFDAERIIANFTRECELAGPERCGFANTTNSLRDDSPTSIVKDSVSEKWFETFSKLQETPITEVYNSNPVYVTESSVRQPLFRTWYTGWFGFKATSNIMQNAALRNLSFFYSGTGPSLCQESRDEGFPTTLIVCTDSGKRRSRPEYLEYVKSLIEESPSWGKMWATMIPACHYWPDIKPPQPLPSPGAKTANKILMVSQTLDLGTPLANAVDAAKKFPSQILEVQGIGHASLGYPSLCAFKEIKKYFDTGSISKDYTQCPASLELFQSMGSVVQMMYQLPLEDRYLLASAIKISQRWPPDNPASYYSGESQLPGLEAGDWWGDKTYRLGYVSRDEFPMSA